MLVHAASAGQHGATGHCFVGEGARVNGRSYGPESKTPAWWPGFVAESNGASEADFSDLLFR